MADVGCGHGASTILLAKAYPRSTFVGFDYHDRSIEWARKTAAKAGFGRVRRATETPFNRVFEACP